MRAARVCSEDLVVSFSKKKLMKNKVFGFS